MRRARIHISDNNGFDLSFIKADMSHFNDKLITIKKINEVPVWKHMMLEDLIINTVMRAVTDASFTPRNGIQLQPYIYKYDVNSYID